MSEPTPLVAATLRLDRNENPWGPVPEVLEALQGDPVMASCYPDPEQEDELCSLLETRWNWPREGIVLGHGSESLLHLFAHAMLQAGDTALVPSPSFPPYEQAVRRRDALPLFLHCGSDYRFDLAGLAGKHPNARALFLCSPDNPTGLEIPAEELLGLVARMPPDFPILLDQAYVDFADEAPPLPDLLAMGSRGLCLIRSFSKLHGMAGLRLGVLLAHPETARRLRSLRSPFSVSRPALLAGLASLRSPALEKVRQRLLHGRERLARGLVRNGLSPLPGKGNFLWFPFARSLALAEALAGRGILVRETSDFGLPEGIRVSIGTPEEIDRLLAVLSDELALLS